MVWIEDLAEEYPEREGLANFYRKLITPIEQAEDWMHDRTWPRSEKLDHLAADTLGTDAEIKYNNGEMDFLEKDKVQFQKKTDFNVSHDPHWHYENEELNSKVMVKLGPENSNAPAQGTLVYMAGEDFWTENNDSNAVRTNRRIREKLAERADNIGSIIKNQENMETQNPARYSGDILRFQLDQQMSDDDILRTWDYVDEVARKFDNF